MNHSPALGSLLLGTPEAAAAIRTAAADAVRFALDNRNALAVVEVAPGAGKTREALAVALALAALGYRVIFALPTVAAAAEKARELEQLVDAGVVVANGATWTVAGALRAGPNGCRVLTEAPAPTRHRLKRVLDSMSRKVCKGCPYFDGCPVAERPRALPGVVTFAAHAGADRMAEISGDEDRAGEGSSDRPEQPPLVVFYDESPDLVTGPKVGRAELQSLARAPKGREWRAKNPGVAEVAEALIKALDSLARDRTETVARSRWKPAQIIPLAALRNPRPGVEAYLDPDRAGWGELAQTAGPPPLPDPEAARRDGGEGWPDRAAWDAVVAVLNRDPHARVRVVPDGGWMVELVAPWSPPKPLEGTDCDPAVVVLDATPNWVALEAVGRIVKAWTVDVVGEAPRLALHLDGARFGNDRFRQGELVTAARNALRLVNRALPNGWQSAPTEARPVVGVLTHMALADAFRGPGQTDESRKAWARLLAAFPEAGEVYGLVERWVVAGIRFEIGHFHADHRASNRFAEVAVLAVVGDPRTHKGAALADAGVLGLDDAGALAYLAAKNAGSAVQALARARFSRPDRNGGPPALIWCGKSPPPVPGGWQRLDPPQGIHTLAEEAEPGRMGLDTIARDLADRCEAIGAAALVDEARRRGVEVKRDAAAAAAAAEGRRRGWNAFRPTLGGKGRPAELFAATAARAEALARWARPVEQGPSEQTTAPPEQIREQTEPTHEQTEQTRAVDVWAPVAREVAKRDGALALPRVVLAGADLAGGEVAAAAALRAEGARLGWVEARGVYAPTAAEAAAVAGLMARGGRVSSPAPKGRKGRKGLK